jgi:hypothetical protein
MTTRTRYFVIASLLVLTVGVGTGLVAYYVGFSTSAFTSAGGPDELRFFPHNATLVAYANVQEVMASNLRQRLRQVLPNEPTGQREFQNQTGINIETDIDRVVGCLTPAIDGSGHPGNGLALVRGRFDAVKIEALMREHGATTEDYQGVRLIVAMPGSGAATGTATDTLHNLALAFIEPGLVGVGSVALVRNAIDLKNGGDNVTANDEVMNLVRTLESGNAWAVGRFDALTSQAKLPNELSQRLPSITWFSAATHIDGGLSGVVRAETRDETAANNLRDVVRGFLALAKMQVGARPELQAMVQSLQLGGTGTTVALSFDIPAEIFDFLGSTFKQAVPKQPVL